MGFLDGLFGAGGDDVRDSQFIEPPNLADLRVQLDPYIQRGQLDPQDVETVQQGDSAYSTIAEDPTLRGGQLDALSQIQATANAGGLDARARAGIEDALEAARTENRGAQGAILANARARGIAGSDLETVSRLVASQGANQASSRAALDVAALREQRRDQALRDSASLSSQIRGQDFSNNSQRASAQDAISRFNAANRQDVANRNVDARTDADRFNQIQRQDISNRNTDTRNDQERYNKGLPLDIFGLQQGVARDRNADARRRDELDQNRSANSTNAILGLVGTAASFFSDERAKEDIQPIDSRKMLEELSGYSYDYKDPSMGAGPQVGVMAQDLERSPFAGAVGEDPGTGMKTVDGGKLAGSMTGLLADINRRLSELEDNRG